MPQRVCRKCKYPWYNLSAQWLHPFFPPSWPLITWMHHQLDSLWCWWRHNLQVISIFIMCSTHLIRFQIAGAFCLFVYDSMLTFPSEYEYIWKARPSWGKVRKCVLRCRSLSNLRMEWSQKLYLIIRYGGLLYATAMIIGEWIICSPRIQSLNSVCKRLICHIQRFGMDYLQSSAWDFDYSRSGVRLGLYLRV